MMLSCARKKGLVPEKTQERMIEQAHERKETSNRLVGKGRYRHVLDTGGVGGIVVEYEVGRYRQRSTIEEI